MQTSARSLILHFAFCILHFDYRSPREMTIFSNVSRTPGSVEWHLRFPRMQNANFGAQSHFAFCILHSAFRLPLPSRNDDLLQRFPHSGVSRMAPTLPANAKCKLRRAVSFCILHFAFCISTTAPLAKSRSPPTFPALRGQSNGTYASRECKM